jgi:hypothetical protein
MTGNARTVEEYLESLPKDRRVAICAVRKIIVDNLPEGYEECMEYGMIGYVVPHRVYPPGYHCDPSKLLPFAFLASQKNYMSLYMMSVYGDPAAKEELRKAFEAAGKKPDIGKSCIRFKKPEYLPLAATAKAISRVPLKRYIAWCERAVKNRREQV